MHKSEHSGTFQSMPFTIHQQCFPFLQKNNRQLKGVRSLRSIILTVGAGIIGSALTRALLRQSYLGHLVILDLLTYAGYRANLSVALRPD